MRQMCVWPALMMNSDNKGKDNKGKDNKSEEPEPAADIENTYGFAMNDFKVAISKQSKMDQVVATIVAETDADADADAVGSGKRKSIVFCHYRREMIQLRDMLVRNGCFVGGGVGGGGGSGGINDIAIIDGTVGQRDRARIFAAEPRVLILQIRTCSEGLNLQSYSDVYFVSPHWNPCVEDQAIARCYRMGQTKAVRVFRFYMSDFVAEADADADADADAENMATGLSSKSISTLDHTCEEIQEKKRIMCNEFLCG